MSAPSRTDGIWTGLLKWSLSQHDQEPPSQAKPLTDEDRKWLSKVFDTLVVDEVRRMKIVVEILRMPDDEEGLRKLVAESSAALSKLREVPLPRAEAKHAAQAAAAAATQGSTLAVPGSQPSASPSPDRSPSPQRSPSPRTAALQAAPLPTVFDYSNASIPELRAEMVRRKEGALEELDDRVLTSDNANDFITVGGLAPLLAALRSPFHGVQWRAAQVLSTLAQNNPKAQRLTFEAGAVERLVPLLEAPTPNVAMDITGAASSDQQDDVSPYEEKWTVVVKALTALSALLRADDLPQIRDSFMRTDGVARLCALLREPATTPRVQTKLFLLLRHLLSWYPHAKALLQQAGVLPLLISNLGRSADINHRESCVRLLVEFAKPTGGASDQAAAKALRDPGLGLKATLSARIKQLKLLSGQSREEKDMLEEELTQSNHLAKLCKF